MVLNLVRKHAYVKNTQGTKEEVPNLKIKKLKKQFKTECNISRSKSHGTRKLHGS